MSGTADQLQRLFGEILDEADNNPGFAHRLARALDALETKDAGPSPRRKSGRRAPAVMDPFTVWPEGEEALRKSLANLTVDQLKDIVAEHGMDRSRLAMKWRTPDRLIDLIIETVRARATKGDAFRSDVVSTGSPVVPDESGSPSTAKTPGHEPVFARLIHEDELPSEGPFRRS